MKNKHPRGTENQIFRRKHQISKNVGLIWSALRRVGRENVERKIYAKISEEKLKPVQKPERKWKYAFETAQNGESKPGEKSCHQLLLLQNCSGLVL